MSGYILVTRIWFTFLGRYLYKLFWERLIGKWFSIIRFLTERKRGIRLLSQYSTLWGTLLQNNNSWRFRRAKQLKCPLWKLTNSKYQIELLQASFKINCIWWPTHTQTIIDICLVYYIQISNYVSLCGLNTFKLNVQFSEYFCKIDQDLHQ